MNEETLYFIDYYDSVRVFNKEKIFYINKKWNKILNKLCIKELTTLEGRVKAISTLTNIKYNVPIYINKKMLFFKISSYNNIYINFYNILDIDYNNNIIYFKGGSNLVIEKSKRSLQSIIKKVTNVVKYL